jgi:hypothetical protein
MKLTTANRDSKLQYYSKGLVALRRALALAIKSGHAYKDKTISMQSVGVTSNTNTTVMCPSVGVDFVTEHLLSGWSASTWRMVRLGIKLIINQQKKLGKISDEDANRLIEIMWLKSAPPKSERVKKTSAQRKKNLTETDLNLLFEFISKSKSNYSYILNRWLLFSSLTGLRPSEWRKSWVKHDAENFILYAFNNKNINNSRLSQTHRELNLNHFDTELKESLVEFVEIMTMLSDDEYRITYKSSIQLLRRANRKIWPYRRTFIQLYSGRHQVSSNFKSQSIDDRYRAAVLGHSTTATSERHYGLTRYGKMDRVPETTNDLALEEVKTPAPKVRPTNLNITREIKNKPEN